MSIKAWLIKEPKKIHDYETQRLLIGLTAFFLPFLVTLTYGRIISSISAYYYTISRNIFVGLLCITGFFLLLYNGRFYYESIISKLAALCAAGTALAPTGYPEDIVENRECLLKVIRSAETLHYIFSITLFAMLIFFCFCFARRASQKREKHSRARRNTYIVCGIIMIASLLAYPLLWIVFPFSPEDLNRIHLLFFCESAALISFGIAWFAAGKPLMHWAAFRR